MNTALLACWLIPAEPHKTCLAELIRALATKYDAPVFEPHVTIYATRTANPNSAASLIPQASQGIRAFALRVERIAFSGQFTKTLFVEFSPSEILSSLARSLKKLAPSPSDYVLEPHLSLIYKHLSESEKQSLARSITIPFSEIVFDEIKAITGNAEVANREDVASWRTLASRRLA